MKIGTKFTKAAATGLSTAMWLGAMGCGAGGGYEDVTPEDKVGALVAKLESSDSTVMFYADDESSTVLASGPAGSENPLTAMGEGLSDVELYEALSGQPAPEALVAVAEVIAAAADAEGDNAEGEEGEEGEDDLIPKAFSCPSSGFSSCRDHTGNVTIAVPGGRQREVRGDIWVRTGSIGDDLRFRVQRKRRNWNTVVDFRPKVTEQWWFRYSQGVKRNFRYHTDDASGIGVTTPPANGYRVRVD